MLKIEFPEYDFKIKRDGNNDWIRDEVRKKWVKLTPEEWVRQNFLQYLIQVKGIPAALMAVEKEIKLGELKKRCDIVVYKNQLPWMIVECKDVGVPLNAIVMEQIIRYNMGLPVEYLVISNGSYSYGWQRKDQQLIALDQLPAWFN